MHLYVLNAKKNIKFILLLASILAVAVIFFSQNKSVVDVFSAGRALPIYSVENTNKKVSITFDYAWGSINCDPFMKQ